MDMIFYPTKAGIKVEFVFKVIPETNVYSFIVTSGASTYENKQNGYIRLLKKSIGEESDINAGIIYNPMIKYFANGQEKIDIRSELNFYSSQGKYVLNIHIYPEIINNKNNKYPIKFNPSFELHQEKVPDSTVYSKFDTNNFLANHAVVGKESALGEGWHYSRMYINKFLFIKSNQVISANFYIKNLYNSTKNDSHLQMVSVDNFWSSGQMIWSTKNQPHKQIISSSINSEYVFDVTNFVKKLVDDETGDTETYGNVIQPIDGFNGYNILSTSDNSEYTPYIRLNFLKE